MWLCMELHVFLCVTCKVIGFGGFVIYLVGYPNYFSVVLVAWERVT